MATFIRGVPSTGGSKLGSSSGRMQRAHLSQHGREFSWDVGNATSVVKNMFGRNSYDEDEMSGPGLDWSTVVDIISSEDEQFEQLVTTLNMKELLDLVSGLQSAMAEEQNRFDDLRNRLDYLSPSLEEGPHGETLSVALCSSQMRLTRLCARNMRCFTQQGVRAKQNHQLIAADADARSSSRSSNGLPPRSEGSLEGDYEEEEDLAEEEDETSQQDSPARTVGFQERLRFFQRQEGKEQVNQSVLTGRKNGIKDRNNADVNNHAISINNHLVNGNHPMDTQTGRRLWAANGEWTPVNGTIGSDLQNQQGNLRRGVNNTGIILDNEQLPSSRDNSDTVSRSESDFDVSDFVVHRTSFCDLPDDAYDSCSAVEDDASSTTTVIPISLENEDGSRSILTPMNTPVSSPMTSPVRRSSCSLEQYDGTGGAIVVEEPLSDECDDHEDPYRKPRSRHHAQNGNSETEEDEDMEDEDGSEDFIDNSANFLSDPRRYAYYPEDNELEVILEEDENDLTTTEVEEDDDDDEDSDDGKSSGTGSVVVRGGALVKTVAVKEMKEVSDYGVSSDEDYTKTTISIVTVGNDGFDSGVPEDLPSTAEELDEPLSSCSSLDKTLSGSHHNTEVRKSSSPDQKRTASPEFNRPNQIDHPDVKTKTEYPINFKVGSTESQLKNEMEAISIGNLEKKLPESQESNSSDRSTSSDMKIINSPERKSTSSPDQKLSSRVSRNSDLNLSSGLERKLSQSPERLISQSPERELSQSPERKLSQSPERKLSRSPERKLSQSPERELSQSPERELSQSPERLISQTPERKLSYSLERKLSSPDRRINLSSNLKLSSPELFRRENDTDEIMNTNIVNMNGDSVSPELRERLTGSDSPTYGFINERRGSGSPEPLPKLKEPNFNSDTTAIPAPLPNYIPVNGHGHLPPKSLEDLGDQENRSPSPPPRLHRKPNGYNKLEHSIEPMTKEPPKVPVKPKNSTLQWDPTDLLCELYKPAQINERSDCRGVNRSNGEHPVLMEGYLETLPMGKPKATFWNSWKRFYFKVHDGHIYIYNGSYSEDPRMTMLVMGGLIERLDDNVIGVDDKRGRYLTLRCNDVEETDDWFEVLTWHAQENFDATYVQPVAYPLSNKKNVIVIDLGGCSTRAGILMDQATLPKVFFPNVCATDKSRSKRIFGSEALTPHVRQNSSISFPIQPSAKITKYTLDVEALPTLFRKVFTELNVDPKQYTVALSVPRTFSTQTQLAVGHLLLDDFSVVGVSMTHQALLTLYAYRATSGIIVDIGDRTDIIPVSEGYVVENGITRLPYGGGRIAHHLNHTLAHKQISLVSDVESYLLRYLLENSCYVAQNYEEESERSRCNPDSLEKTISVEEFFQESPPFKSVTMEFGRFHAPEGLFNPKLWGLDSPGLPKLVHRAIQECGMDVRREMARSIFLSGGVTCLPGFAQRLENELDKLTPPTVIPKVHASPYRQHMAFLGACQMALSNEFRHVCINRDEWRSSSSNQQTSFLRRWHL